MKTAATCAMTAGVLAGMLVAPASMPVAEADDDIDHVVAISIDGLNPAAITRLGPAGAPNYHRLLDSGAGTLNARALFRSTKTLPNHVSMVTGRRGGGRHGHGVLDNGKGQAVHGASVFSVVHDHGGQTGLYSAKDKLALLNRSWNSAHGGRDRVGQDNGRDKIDVYRRARDKALVAAVVHDLSSRRPEFTLLHLARPDRVGHEHGFMGRKYIDAVAVTDRQIGRVLRAVERDPYLSRSAAVVVTADHGGLGHNDHENPGTPANYTVPFIVWGPGVERGANLYALNPDRRRPGRGRPWYSGKQPVRNADLANLTTDLLDLPAVSGSTINRPRRLDVDR